ncbi:MULTISPECIES: LysR family transcriptional regulator [unclassified Herbaspirillum]|uniref:LysR family transcriptional regulator n=1 Tax=unclassified Herbaspirillum TaxID=2624150 RepID=UPI00115068F6|nr:MULTISPECIES: LysR family transcriptional regulator [unclassified Herbaspirillum]MBB5391040.1 DNA-binding transcriptional LysR family regulator [Herbaspirillum sp. SJZ102]TQK13261.1 DNA-binding transcriptional LysR family regulator [Herbaspirillum sp. SJZ130]TQK15265.1 DNA-binding transcriptional LysR family regulator [Herbaspirillum sp. SJZ106]
MATDRLGDMRLFADTAVLGSLSAAGRKLGLSPAAASARLLKLETALHAKLFHRSTRKLRLTEEGRVYLRYCKIALEAIDDAEAELLANTREISGKIRISASADFGRRTLKPWLDEFCRQHPHLKIALSLSDGLADLLRDDIDLAIRFGMPAEGTLATRRLAPNWRVLCATPAYLARHGTPQTVEDLAHHDFVLLSTSAGPLSELRFQKNGHRQCFDIPLARAWETNDGALAREWMLDGKGLARKTIWDAIDDIRCGKITSVLDQHGIEEAGVHAVFHAGTLMPARVRALLDFLVIRFDRATSELLSVVHAPGKAGVATKATTPKRLASKK